MRKWYRTEVEVHDTLKDLQGTLIPNLLSTFTVRRLLFSSSQEHKDEEKEEKISKHTSNSAILLEFIDSFPLKHITHYCPKESWQSICDDAINTILLASDKGIINKDTRTWNFNIRRNNFKAVMIDLAICDFRRQYKNEEEWRCSKANWDEKVAVGYVMEKNLSKDWFVYKRFEMYEKLDQDIMETQEHLKALTVS